MLNLLFITLDIIALSTDCTMQAKKPLTISSKLKEDKVEAPQI